MFIIPYHAKMRLKKFGKFLVFLCLLLVVVGIFLFFWLERYIVYTREGLYFDFERPTTALSGQGQEITATENTDSVRIVYDDNGDDTNNTGLQPISGYYGDTEMIIHDLPGLRSQIEALPPGTSVMLDVKSIYGNFYYSTGLTDASTSSAVDIAAMDELISYMKKSGLYMIARVPAFCDPAYALAHQSAGLPLSSGALWMDENGCYWLDPSSATVLNYLSAIAGELSKLGFDEVVFSDFVIPDNDSIVYDTGSSSARDILGRSAENLVNAFMGQDLVISFSSDDPAFPIPSTTSRLFLTDTDAAGVESIAGQAVSLTDPAIQLVFVTESRDTRYDTYSTLRSFTLPES